MINTPGYYYSLAYWLAAFIVTCTNEKRIRGVKRYVTHLVFLAAIVGFMEVTDGVRTSLFLPCMLVSVSLFLIYIYRCCQFSLAEAGYYCARAFISGEFAASFGWQIYYYTVKTFRVNHAVYSGCSLWSCMRSYLEFYICWKNICKKAAKKCISIVGSCLRFCSLQQQYLQQKCLLSGLW